MFKQKRKTMRAAKAHQTRAKVVAKQTVKLKKLQQQYQAGGVGPDACKLPGFASSTPTFTLPKDEMIKLCRKTAQMEKNLGYLKGNYSESLYDFTNLAKTYHIIQYNDLYFFVHKEELKKNTHELQVYMLKEYNAYENPPVDYNPALLKLHGNNLCGYSYDIKRITRFMNNTGNVKLLADSVKSTQNANANPFLKARASTAAAATSAFAGATSSVASVTPSGRPVYNPPPPPPPKSRRPAPPPPGLTINDIYTKGNDGSLDAYVAASIINTYMLDVSIDISLYFRIKSVDGDIYMFSQYEIYELPAGETPKHVYVPKLYKGEYVLCAVNNEDGSINTTLVKQGQLAEDIEYLVFDDTTFYDDFKPVSFPMSKVKALIDPISISHEPQADEEPDEEPAEETKPPSRSGSASSTRSRRSSTSSTGRRHSPPPANNNSGMPSASAFSASNLLATASKLRPTPQQEPKPGQNLFSQIRNADHRKLKKRNSKEEPGPKNNPPSSGLYGAFNRMIPKPAQNTAESESSGEFGDNDNTPVKSTPIGKTLQATPQAAPNVIPKVSATGTRNSLSAAAAANSQRAREQTQTQTQTNLSASGTAKPAPPAVAAKPKPAVAAKPKPQTAPNQTEGASGRRTPPHGASAAASNSVRRRSPSPMRRQNMGAAASPGFNPSQISQANLRTSSHTLKKPKAAANQLLPQPDTAGVLGGMKDNLKKLKRGTDLKILNKNVGTEDEPKYNGLRDKYLDDKVRLRFKSANSRSFINKIYSLYNFLETAGRNPRIIVVGHNTKTDNGIELLIYFIINKDYTNIYDVEMMPGFSDISKTCETCEGLDFNDCPRVVISDFSTTETDYFIYGALTADLSNLVSYYVDVTPKRSINEEQHQTQQRTPTHPSVARPVVVNRAAIHIANPETELEADDKTDKKHIFDSGIAGFTFDELMMDGLNFRVLYELKENNLLEQFKLLFAKLERDGTDANYKLIFIQKPISDAAQAYIYLRVGGKIYDIENVKGFKDLKTEGIINMAAITEQQINNHDWSFLTSIDRWPTVVIELKTLENAYILGKGRIVNRVDQREEYFIYKIKCHVKT